MDRDEMSARVGELLQEREEALAVAESLTGGLLANAFAVAPAASDWFLGGVVAYRKAVKFGPLGVPEGPVVTEQAATAMADGVRELLGADVAVGVTGAGGPDPQDGQPPGTVWIAVRRDGATATREHHFDGDPPSVCAQAAEAAVALLLDVLEG